MSSNGQPKDSDEFDADLAEAFKDIARGERTAAALEDQLSSVEKRIDDLLARADQDQQNLERQAEKVESTKAAIRSDSLATDEKPSVPPEDESAQK